MTAHSLLYLRSRSGSSLYSARLRSEGFQVRYLRRFELLGQHCAAQSPPFEVLIAEGDAIGALDALPPAARPRICVALADKPDRPLSGVLSLPSSPHPEELLARLRALLRRAHGYPLEYRIGTLGIDVLRGRVSLAGRLLDLQPRELRVLTLLASRPGQAISSSELAATLQPGGTVSASLVPTYIGRLRRRIGPRFIETLPGIGYRLRPPGQPRRSPEGNGKPIPPQRIAP